MLSKVSPKMGDLFVGLLSWYLVSWYLEKH